MPCTPDGYPVCSCPFCRAYGDAWQQYNRAIPRLYIDSKQRNLDAAECSRLDELDSIRDQENLTIDLRSI